MENNNDIPGKHPIVDRLAILLPEEDWQPDLARGLQLLHLKQNQKGVHHSRLIWGTVCAAAIGIMIVTFPATRVLAARYISACLSFVGRLSGTGGNLAYTEVGHRDLAPELSFNDEVGTALRLSELRGKVVLLTFWTPNCGACDTEMRWFTEFQQTYRGRDFIYLNQQVLAGSKDVLRQFGRSQTIPTIPTTFLIDKSGRIAVTHVGLCTKREYETAIEALLNEPQ